ncbi:MAG: hypothetical protein K1X57_21295 [Gemmataceae bacterium]|nr:hypothetical protein [Gemmataceae bacterium]
MSLGPPSLTGRWSGAYEQHGREGPIEAEFQVDDAGRLTGTMRDLVTDQDLSLFDAAASAGLPPGYDEQVEARLREVFPDQAAQPIRFVSHVPPDSDLEGEVEGIHVRFRKTYRGESHSGYRVGDNVLIGGLVNNHAVNYRGKLGPDGQTIEGRWWIDADPERRTPRDEGSFQLRRHA